jgi:hypothetical protein
MLLSAVANVALLFVLCEEDRRGTNPRHTLDKEDLMERWLKISMSTEYFRSIQGTFSMDDNSDGYVAESQEFWMFADDLLASSLEIYSLHPFIGAEKGGGGPDIPALLVAFGAGTLAPMVTAFVQYLMKYLSRNENRELTIERGDVKLTLKGRSLAEEKELIRMLFPEMLEQPKATNHEDHSRLLNTHEELNGNESAMEI